MKQRTWDTRLSHEWKEEKGEDEWKFSFNLSISIQINLVQSQCLTVRILALKHVSPDNGCLILSFASIYKSMGPPDVSRSNDGDSHRLLSRAWFFHTEQLRRERIYGD